MSRHNSKKRSNSSRSASRDPTQSKGSDAGGKHRGLLSWSEGFGEKAGGAVNRFGEKASKGVSRFGKKVSDYPDKAFRTKKKGRKK
tara:strand:+ start:170 stop:427 length:258 start_codon:yes stop_codon:yes gene_type:complete